MDRLKTIDYNPDILSCLANLSNDEVFTSPSLANEILDLLPSKIWSDKTIKFLDPSCKTGIFLREITKRLIEGIKDEIPDLQKRINHILTKQIFGVGITELTSLMSRRSLYCSKTVNGKYSICTSFNTPDGNIHFKRTKHTWKNGSCVKCGASKVNYDRGNELETHAYEFIHKNTKEIFENMKFDVIIGNPPYQLSDGGAQQSASPIYHKFIEQAKKLNPRYISMIIPARWYSGGKGLDNFRRSMLNDQRISEIHDFPETSDCFPGLNIRGGVCYFLWDSTHKTGCHVYNHKNGNVISEAVRPLTEKGLSIFVRYNQAISILRKVQSFNEETMDTRMSSRKPFGIPTNFSDFKDKQTDGNNIKLYRFGENAYINQSQVLKKQDMIDKVKVLIAKASPGGDEYPHSVLSSPIIADFHSVCTETYLVAGPFKDNNIAANVVSYMKSRFFRFLVILIKNTQDLPKRVYSFVPVQDFSEPWTDEKLYAKYDISEEEIIFINSMIKPMSVGSISEELTESDDIIDDEEYDIDG